MTAATRLLLLPLCTAAALRVSAFRTAPLAATYGSTATRSSRPAISMAEDGGQTRVVVQLPTELLAAKTKTKTKQAEKPVQEKGLRSVSVGSFTINFNKDMTISFRGIVIIFALLAIRVIRKGKYAFTDEPAFQHMARTLEEEAELHEFQCETCGFTMFPARGREGKFFPDDFRCPNCNAAKEAFFDMNDLSDPRTIKAQQEDKDFDYEIQEIEVTLPDPDEEGTSDGKSGSGPSSSS